MKKLMLLFTGIFLMLNFYAQAPDYFHYQAVLRKADGSLMANKEVSIQVELIRGSVDGNSVYIENHSVLTNQRGMVILKVGDGTFFNEVDWEKGPYFLSMTVDGVHLGTSQLLSVPYALFAKRAGSVYDDDSDPTNEFQTLSINDKTLEISDGNSVILPDVSTPWELYKNTIHYHNNVGIGAEANLPLYPLDIIKEVDGVAEPVLLRLRNTDEGGKSATSMVLESFEDIIAKTFYRSEFILTSADYDQIPNFRGMTAIIAEGNGLSLASKSTEGSLRFYTTTVQDTLVERARIDPAGNLGIGTVLPKAKVHVEEGDVYIQEIGRGIIMQSLNGKKWRITVDNTGTLVTTEIAIK